ncbi:mCG1041502, partial [Mus musculus]
GLGLQASSYPAFGPASSMGGWVIRVGFPIQTDTATREFSVLPAIRRSRPQEELFQQLQLFVPPTVAIGNHLKLSTVLSFQGGPKAAGKKETSGVWAACRGWLGPEGAIFHWSLSTAVQ